MQFHPDRYRSLLLLFLLVFSSGCAVIAGGVIGGSTTAYIRGVLKTKEPASFDKVWFAVVETVEREEFKVVTKESNSGRAFIEAKLTDRDKIAYITVKYDKPEITDLVIRVGIWGEEEESRRILKLIHQKLY